MVSLQIICFPLCWFLEAHNQAKFHPGVKANLWVQTGKWCIFLFTDKNPQQTKPLIKTSKIVIHQLSKNIRNNFWCWTFCSGTQGSLSHFLMKWISAVCDSSVRWQKRDKEEITEGEPTPNKSDPLSGDSLSWQMKNMKNKVGIGHGCLHKT